ncbi:MAG TPA: 2-amino-4-hydroxy-6-hydroxymethyldihydropteridine diphosphokinase [Terracidiphilus sp.]|jgi:2-amino-4-hydroxy-6-hydroxymethyldihydropteridine diphosphokinase|nr:2-amino-4-hydroxy-6-hydroxymethyldihydropteridine diphosphokinase [Terracidiphilus sp.]
MHTACIGMGANLPSSAGPPEVTLAAAAVRLQSLGRVAALSSLYSTTPVGFAGQPNFLNAAAVLETNLTPFELLGALLLIEKEFGRNRTDSLTNGPRTLDLDILLYDDFVIGGSSLIIPHIRLSERAFVLVPLNEIAPHAIDPCSSNTVAQLLQKLRTSIPNREDESHAVVQIQSDLWRPFADSGIADSSQP